MSDRPVLLPVAEAQARLIASARPVALENAPLADAVGRWLTGPMLARRTQPIADLSAMDGYAIRHADLPGPWRVTGESAAGRPFAGPVGAGEAARIFTGAVMPSGSDTVLIQEEAARDWDRLILSGEGPGYRGRNTRRRGLDFMQGDRLCEGGARVTPALIGLVATAGHGLLPVRRRVRVALAATGDELVAPGSADPDALPESNTPMLAAMLADLPVELIALGILPDRLDALVETFRSVEADLLVTTGGASVGDHDLVRPALEAAGGSIHFWRVALRPGKPVLAGAIGDMMVLGLPGNPVSVFVTAMLFVRPVIAAMAGAAAPLPMLTPARLAEPLDANGARDDYLRGHIDATGAVRVAAIQDSSMLLTLARANCLVHRPAYAPAAAPGDLVEILHVA